MNEDKEYINGESGIPETGDQISGQPVDTADEPAGYEIIGVTFKSAGKIYYFDASGITARQGQSVIVDTSRGTEYGKVALSNRTVPAKDLVLPLRKVIRIADSDDDDRYRANCEKEEEAFTIGLKKIAEHGLNMKLIDVGYTFDNAKLMFYFTSEERVDFRELVKDLASIFRTRIELRQIGLRDEAKIMGGYGICGREFCCHSFLGDFVQVSIKMAKEQNLALNASKISGACGRLMCCLRYEHEVYQEELKRLPRVDSKVLTPDGEGTVTEVHPLTGLVKVRRENDPDKSVAVYDKSMLRTLDGKPFVEKKSDDQPGAADRESVPEEPQKQTEVKKKFRASEGRRDRQAAVNAGSDDADERKSAGSAPANVRKNERVRTEEPAAEGAAGREQGEKRRRRNKKNPVHKVQVKAVPADGEKSEGSKHTVKAVHEHKAHEERSAKPAKHENGAEARPPKQTREKNAGEGGTRAGDNEKKNNNYRRRNNRRRGKKAGNPPENKS